MASAQGKGDAEHALVLPSRIKGVTLLRHAKKENPMSLRMISLISILSAGATTSASAQYRNGPFSNVPLEAFVGLAVLGVTAVIAFIVWSLGEEFFFSPPPPRKTAEEIEEEARRLRAL